MDPRTAFTLGDFERLVFGRSRMQYSLLGALSEDEARGLVGPRMAERLLLLMDFCFGHSRTGGIFEIGAL
ncbi:MAG: hypothetical protein EBR79_01925 [Proteobacteria bacterium]|nr:hypothetical protein [Pseudomonadota bacterium]NBX86557.1 hypothetical protein [Pseudomonadota bacterium]